MAITKIHPIRATVGKAVDYICNPDKTEEKILISSFACAPETAEYDFKYTLSKSSRSDKNLAYHLIQSFAPGEVGFDEAHRIGEQLAEQFLQGKYSYVLTTHVDHAHIHNHLIFCATDNIDFKKYNDCKQTYYQIRKLSDDLCREHGLSIIEEQQAEHLGRCYKEWQADKAGTSWKSQLRKDINAAIKVAFDYAHFIQLIRAKGYEVKGIYDLRYISFKPTGSDRWIRGRDRSLGWNYTRERIIERMKERREILDAVATESVREKQSLKPLLSLKNDSAALKKWESRENLKRASEAYSRMQQLGYSSTTEISLRISETTNQIHDRKSDIKDIEKQTRNLSELLKYVRQYYDNKPYHDRYKEANNKESVYRKYEGRLMLYGAAKDQLIMAGIDIRALDVSALEKELNELYYRKQKCLSSMQSMTAEIKELNSISSIIREYIGSEDIDGIETVTNDTVVSETVVPKHNNRPDNLQK